jgi:hypothetical protein
LSRSKTLVEMSARLTAIYDERPTNLSERLSPLQRELAQLRDELRRQFKGGLNNSVLEKLRQVNQALSLLHAAAYPAGATDWQTLHQASALLRQKRTE